MKSNERNDTGVCGVCGWDLRCVCVREWESERKGVCFGWYIVQQWDTAARVPAAAKSLSSLFPLSHMCHYCCCCWELNTSCNVCAYVCVCVYTWYFYIICRNIIVLGTLCPRGDVDPFVVVARAIILSNWEQRFLYSKQQQQKIKTQNSKVKLNLKIKRHFHLDINSNKSEPNKLLKKKIHQPWFEERFSTKYKHTQK